MDDWTRGPRRVRIDEEAHTLEGPSGRKLEWVGTEAWTQNDDGTWRKVRVRKKEVQI